MKRSDIKNKFGQAIRRLRCNAELSQEAFAALCELHRTYIGAIERGEKNVTLETAERIATALNLSLSELIRESENQ